MQEINSSPQKNTIYPQYYSPSGPTLESSFGNDHYKSTSKSSENSPYPGNFFGRVQQFFI